MIVLVEAVHTALPPTNTSIDRYVDWYGERTSSSPWHKTVSMSSCGQIAAVKWWGSPMGQAVLLMRSETMEDYQKAAGVSLRRDEVGLPAHGPLPMGVPCCSPAQDR